MTDFETLIWKAISEADRAFGKAGDSGTKTWMRDYFLPSLERNGLEIRQKVKLGAEAEIEIERLKAELERLKKAPCAHDREAVDRARDDVGYF